MPKGAGFPSEDDGVVAAEVAVDWTRLDHPLGHSGPDHDLGAGMEGLPPPQPPGAALRGDVERIGTCFQCGKFELDVGRGCGCQCRDRDFQRRERFPAEAGESGSDLHVAMLHLEQLVDHLHLGAPGRTLQRLDMALRRSDQEFRCLEHMIEIVGDGFARADEGGERQHQRGELQTPPDGNRRHGHEVAPARLYCSLMPGILACSSWLPHSQCCRLAQ